MASELRKRFHEFLILHRKAPKTRKAYLWAVAALSAYYRRSPDRLDAEEVQRYLLYLIDEKKLAWSTCNVALSALVCFYRDFLKREDLWLSIPRRRRGERRLPQVLSVEEVRSLLDAAAGNPKHHALLMTAYCAGLRVSEVVRLKPGDIESSPSRMMIRVDQGKGKKDRYTILTSDCLSALRSYYRACRPAGIWLFPGRDPDQPLSISSAQKLYGGAKKKPA
jgi:site-specific recombinase XerD